MSNNCSVFAFSGSKLLSTFDVLLPNSCVGMEEVLFHQGISKCYLVSSLGFRGAYTH